MTFDYDLFVIGAGSGGLAASKRAASYGAKVAIAEHDLVGGTCVIRGCVPKKLLVYASGFSNHYQEAVGYGWSAVESQLDWQHLITTVDQEVRRLSNLHISFLEKAGVELIPGYAQFVDPHTVEVDGKIITADKILIAVGGEAVRPDIPGAEYTLSSREMFHLTQQPRRIVIVGGGYIGVEFAGILRGLGSEVTQIIRRDRILKGFDEDIRNAVQAGMTEHGITILTETKLEKIEKTDEGLQVYLAGDHPEPLITDAVLMATGRIPSLKGLGLEKVGVQVIQGDGQCKTPIEGYDVEGAVKVDDYSRTSQPNIFAVGDCTDRVNLTPVAIGEGRAFADTEFGNHPRHLSYQNVPSAVFSQPEAATVGMSEAQAREQFGDSV